MKSKHPVLFFTFYKDPLLDIHFSTMAKNSIPVKVNSVTTNFQCFKKCFKFFNSLNTLYRDYTTYETFILRYDLYK